MPQENHAESPSNSHGHFLPKFPKPLRISPPRAEPKIQSHKHGKRQGKQKNHQSIKTCCELLRAE
jgi:hypothetical protein